MGTSETDSRAELLHALGHLVRGLSALFWGMPLALVIGVQTARTDWLRPLGLFPPVLTGSMLLYGLVLLGHFRPQERPWRHAREWATAMALVNLGLSPFLYWWHSVPAQAFFLAMVLAQSLNGLLFLYTLNVLLQRLTAMLPDETLRHETRFFTAFNRHLVLITTGLLLLYWATLYWDPIPITVLYLLQFIDQMRLAFLVLLILLPLSVTMALLWKVKEVILSGVFTSDTWRDPATPGDGG